LRFSVRRPAAPSRRGASRTGDAMFLVAVGLAAAWATWRIVGFVSVTLASADLLQALDLGFLTLLRVVAMIALASLIWVPVGVWLGLRPVWARRSQPVTQFLAAFPANLLFPPFVVFIVHFRLNPEIWLTPLMVL